MCFVIFMAVGAFAVSLWLHGNLLYGALAGSVALVFLFFFIRKLVKNGPCIFGNKKGC
jgi:hypothetical protein